jgi:hypothetical protein
VKSQSRFPRTFRQTPTFSASCAWGCLGAVLAVLAATWPARAQPVVGRMPLQVAPMEEQPDVNNWFTIATWNQAGVSIVFEARHGAVDDSTATVPSLIAVRTTSGDDSAELAEDSARVAFHEWDQCGVTLEIREISPDRVAVMWVFMNPFDEDDGDAGYAHVEAAALVGWNEAEGRVFLVESWPGTGTAPAWLRSGLADDVDMAIEAGSIEEAARGLQWLEWVGEVRAARRVGRAWARARDAAERVRNESSVRDAIEAGRFDEAERGLTVMERDRASRRTAQDLRARLTGARTAWFDTFAIGGIHHGMDRSEARTACSSNGGSWSVNAAGTTASCTFHRGIGSPVLGINGPVSVGLITEAQGVETLVVSWTPETAAHLARLGAAVAGSVIRMLGPGSNRSALKRGTGAGQFWRIGTRRVVDEMLVSIPADLPVPYPHRLSVSFRATR